MASRLIGQADKDIENEDKTRSLFDPVVLQENRSHITANNKANKHREATEAISRSYSALMDS